MNQDQLEERLKVHFSAREKEVVASSRLVYEARARRDQAERKREAIAKLRPMVYGILLHLLWSVTIVGGTFFLKGATQAFYVMIWNLVMSMGLIVGGCIALPQFMKQFKEGEI